VSLQSTPMQVALAWLLQRAPNILLIPGTSSVKHLRENLDAATLELPPKRSSILTELPPAVRSDANRLDQFQPRGRTVPLKSTSGKTMMAAHMVLRMNFGVELYFEEPSCSRNHSGAALSLRSSLG